MTKAARRRRMPPRIKTGPRKGQFRKRARANPRRATYARPNPPRRRRRARRNPLTYSKYTTTKSGKSRRTRHVSVRTSRLSKKGKAKLAALRAAGTPFTYEALHSLKRHERRATVAKKHKKSKKSHRKGKRSHASYVAAGKKAARTKAARKAARSRAGKKAHRKGRKTSRRARRAPLVTARRGTRIRARSRRGGKIQRYRIRARYPKSAKGRLRLSARRNPGMSTVKNMLMDGAMLYGGLLGMRVIKNLINTYVVQKYVVKPGQSATTAKLIGCLPAAGAFAFAIFAPKFVKSPKLLSGIQAGATLVLFDAIFTTFIKPALPPNVSNMLGGGMGFYGGEYIAQRPRLPMMGAVAREAMALDEYVQQPGMGAYDVNEALAGSEVQAMQTGYAGGSLARTLFSS